MPLQTLEANINNVVTLITRRNYEYTGILKDLDEHGNIYLADTNLKSETCVQFLNEVIVSTNNVVIIKIGS